jgi:hypothetical protein
MGAGEGGDVDPGYARALLDVVDAAKLNLCQQIVCHNPAKALDLYPHWADLSGTRQTGL